MTILNPLLLAILLQSVAAARSVAPVLEFPEPGLDDPVAYEEYSTRFFQDAHGNAFQVYLNQRHGRVVNLWANAANESIGFTVRDSSSQPARLEWGSRHALVQSTGRSSFVEYTLSAEAAPLDIGWFLLGSMRLERDFQYQEGHLRQFGAPPFQQQELLQLIAQLERLGPAESRHHMRLLNTASIQDLRVRLHPTASLTTTDSTWVVRVTQPSFDGRNHLALELSFDRREVDIEIRGHAVSVLPRPNHAARALRMTVRGTTDGAALTPLNTAQIFNADFLRFYETARAERARILRTAPEARSAANRDRLRAFRRLERQVRSVGLMSYEEKLLAGLPNYATYFGRDMLMAALMMEPVWSEAMSEHVIASVLRKLTPSGEVSHEEALGGQAIRENAAAYNTLLEEYFQHRSRGEATAANSVLTRAGALLEDLQAVRENYVMVDDDFQFPVLVARYLIDSRVPTERKRSFLLAPARAGRTESRLDLLLRNLAYVSRMAAPYAHDAVATNLVSFPERTDSTWFPGSWRDSNAGYAGGRFAMDINVIWVPAALKSVAQILASLGEIGFGIQQLDALAGPGSPLLDYARNPASLTRAVEAWESTARHFRVRLGAEEAGERIRAKLNWLPEAERAYWKGVLQANPIPRAGVEFLALSLDGSGRPIPVVNTDPATRLFLDSPRAPDDSAVRDIRALLLAYPAGLYVAGLGPLVANDAYATPRVWENFRKDHYHSPRVVWGREVNLLILGLTKQINAAFNAQGVLRDPALEPYVRDLSDALRRTLAAVESSGLKHAELWTYRIENGRLVPVRYPVSTDIQLWNLTDLAVQYELARMPPALRIPGIFPAF